MSILEKNEKEHVDSQNSVLLSLIHGQEVMILNLLCEHWIVSQE